MNNVLRIQKKVLSLSYQTTTNTADGPKAENMKNNINTYDQVIELISNGNVRRIFNYVDFHFVSKHEIEYSDLAMLIIEIVAKYGEGFVVDICNRVMEKNIQLSEKQRWSIAFALLKITVEQVEEDREFNEAEIERIETDISETAKKAVFDDSDSSNSAVSTVKIENISFQVVNTGGFIILYDFDKWDDATQIAEILHLDSWESQPVIIKQRSGSPIWRWEILGPAYEGLHFNDYIDPVSGEEDLNEYMKITEDSVTYAVAIAIQK